MPEVSIKKLKDEKRLSKCTHERLISKRLFNFRGIRRASIIEAIQLLPTIMTRFAISRFQQILWKYCQVPQMKADKRDMTCSMHVRD